ncbi:MAG: HipA family kinase [Thiolinea sp.]
MKELQITEIIGRANQGATRPFICRAEDGKLYYVKGKSASTGERIREWIGANLAAVFGLTVPPMALLEIPKSLLDVSDSEVQHDLGLGFAVGSQQILAVDELRVEDISFIPLDIQQAIAVFDLWLQNEDRTLSVLGGNPNLLYQQSSQRVYAIDYNLILPDYFDLKLFHATHVFREALKPEILPDTNRQVFAKRMRQALLAWPQFVQRLPDSWLDENETTHAFAFTDVLQRLQEQASGALWRNLES